MNIPSALLSSIINIQDLETWGNLDADYLPSGYEDIYRAIDNHVTLYNRLPSFEDIKLSVPSPIIKEQAAILEALEVDSEPFLLLEYLKNEYTQSEILDKLDKYLDKSVMMADAEESIEGLDIISQEVRRKVELDVASVSMNKITVLESEEDIKSHMILGLNDRYDMDQKFAPSDLILIGGRRGVGKSFTCANLAVTKFKGRERNPNEKEILPVSSLYFTIEMTKEQTFRRMAAIHAKVPLSKMSDREQLSVNELERLAMFQRDRYENSQTTYGKFMAGEKTYKTYEAFEQELIVNHILHPDKQLDIVYDPQLSLEKIKATLYQKVDEQKIKIVIVDYLNQVKIAGNRKHGQFDWMEQVEVSKGLKQIAQDFKVLLVTPYQTDATGEARFAKGVLDAADAAFTLETWRTEEDTITFDCQKMRNGPMKTFSSKIDWKCLKIGPDDVVTPTWENLGMKRPVGDDEEGYGAEGSSNSRYPRTQERE